MTSTRLHLQNPGVRRPSEHHGGELRTGRWPVRRWVAACAAAETIGMTAAAAAAQGADRLPQTLQHRAPLVLAVVMLGGLVEGVALGAFQGRVMGSVLEPAGSSLRRRWTVVTVLVAGLGWAAASPPAAMSGADDATQPSLAVILPAAAALGAAMGTVLGLAQAWSMGAEARHPFRWVWLSAAAWTPTMAVIFAGATLPAADWPIGVVILIGTLTGLAAGTVLGLVSGPFLHVLDSTHPRRNHDTAR